MRLPARDSGPKASSARAATTYFIIETCKFSRGNPFAYIADFMHKIASMWPSARLNALMPCGQSHDFRLLDHALYLTQRDFIDQLWPSVPD